MVETPYALKKYIEAKNKVYTADQQEYTSFLFNLETRTTFNALKDMVDVAKQDSGVDGIVFGRVDFAGSNDQSRSAVDLDEMTQYIVATAEACKPHGLDLVVGGAVSSNSLDALKKIRDVHLTRFETRKVIFDSSVLDNANAVKALEQTIYFELQWLKNKRDYYHAIKHEDSNRIDMLEKRWLETK
jgi:hypothetical protein